MKMKKFENDEVVTAIDPGYDGTKVTVNGKKFSIPKKTVKKIGNEYEQMGDLQGIYEISIESGTYLCGPNIGILVDDNRDFHERVEKASDRSGNYSYFATQEFLANALAGYAMALIKAEEEKLINLNKIDSSKLQTVIALPHEALESMSKTVAGLLLGEHEFTFKGNVSGETKEYTFKFSIEKQNFLVISQVMACLLGYMTDEDGCEAEDPDELLPALIIDGGYYTIGDFTISKTKAISFAESNTSYGMMVIHTKVAEELNKQYGTAYTYLDMSNIFEEESGIIIIPKNISKSGINERVDCNELLDKITRKVFKEYITYLEEKHNYFTKIKQILFGGGTGSIYYELFQEIASEYPNVTAKLVTYELNGEVVTPREAISAGAYKMMVNRIA